jgi:hypothetical protein
LGLRVPPQGQITGYTPNRDSRDTWLKASLWVRRRLFVRIGAIPFRFRVVVALDYRGFALHHT